MKNSIVVIDDKKNLENIINFVLDDFKSREKAHYSKDGLSLAISSLKDFDVFSSQELNSLVKAGKVKVYALVNSGMVLGVSALMIKEGRILFISVPNDDKKQTSTRKLIERMVEERDSEIDSKLDILAFVGQVKNLTSIGFMRLYDTVLHQNHLKFVPLRFNYAQLDVEK